MTAETMMPVTDRETYTASLRNHAEPPSDDRIKLLDIVGAVMATVMALGPLTVFAIFRGAGYSL